MTTNRAGTTRVLALVVAGMLGMAAAAAGLASLLVLRPSPGADEARSPVLGAAVPRIVESPSVRIAVAGDTGTGDDAEAATARVMVGQSRVGPPYDALVLLGDLVYEDGDADQVDTAVAGPFAELLDAGTELVPALGNHDYVSGEQQTILSSLGRDRSWYVARFGPLRVVVLDSERVTDPHQQRWLERVLAAPEPAGTWTVAAMHHPAYSAGEHGSTAEVRQRWVPLFGAHDVPLVLAGHDHDYQRSRPLDGVTYVVSGAGAKLRPTGREDFTAVSSAILHYVDLLVYDDRMVGTAIDQSGRLIDRFTLTRAP